MTGLYWVGPLVATVGTAGALLAAGWGLRGMWDRETARARQEAHRG